MKHTTLTGNLTIITGMYKHTVCSLWITILYTKAGHSRICKSYRPIFIYTYHLCLQ